MNPSFYFAAGILISLLALPQDDVKPLAPVPTLTPSKSSTPKPQLTKPPSQRLSDSPNAKDEQIKAEVEAIMEIRRQLGGGVIEQLGQDFSTAMLPNLPSSLDKPSTGSLRLTFEEQLAKHLSEPPLVQENIVPLGDRPQKPDRSRFHPIDRSGPNLISTGSNPQRRQKIRQAARLLEQAAAMLEETGDFDQADSVRSSAAELWKTAR